MDKKRSLTLDGMSGKNVLLIFMGLGITGISIYLTRHYFHIHFNTSLEASTLCQINSYWNCDTATNSPMSAIFNIPTAIFGLFFGIMILAGSLFYSEDFEKANSTISKINLLGCIGFFIYSIVSLGSICPMCFGYYLLSLAVAALYWRYGIPGVFFPKILFTVFLPIFVLLGGSFGYYVTAEKEKTQKGDIKLRAAVIKSYDSYQNLGDPDIESPFRIITSTDEFSKAPIRVSFYSDFQCPACLKINEQIHRWKMKYQGKMNVQYMFYPLDPSCNSEVKFGNHNFSCKASYLATCSGDQFVKVHDDLYANQKNITNEWIDDYAKKLGVSECMTQKQTKKTVIDLIETAKKYGIRSTPTIIINGVKVEGVMPFPVFQAIFDELLRRSTL